MTRSRDSVEISPGAIVRESRNIDSVGAMTQPNGVHADLADAQRLVQRIVAIYPDFDAWWADDRTDELPAPAYMPTRQPSPHAVYRSLFTFVGRHAASEAQIAGLAALLNDAVAAGGDAENAASTCFLEHLGRSSLHKALWRQLLPATRRSARA